MFNLPTHRVNHIDTDGGLNWFDLPLFGCDQPHWGPFVVVVIWFVSDLTTYNHIHGLCLNRQPTSMLGASQQIVINMILLDV